MRIPETPSRCEDLGLMERLAAYGEGKVSWRGEERIGDSERAECRRLHAALVSIVTKVFGPMLDRVNAREMRTFTMHDSTHGLKVAHLMWHITKASKQQQLTPPEIALLVLSAHLHDLGMGLLDDVERKQRLSPGSDLWHKVDALGSYRKVLDDLTSKIQSGNLSPNDASLAISQVNEAQDMLLCLDCRERHASSQRYMEIISSFREAHIESPTTIPSIDEAMRFGDDSFATSLIDVCVSHNEDAAVLLEGKRDRKNELRFPQGFPVGTSEADLRFVAATLRLADILDFDRERVPSVLYHYLLPRSSKPSENISVREWQKHMSISNWSFDADKVLFKGRSSNAVAHHAVVEFGKIIEGEIRRTRAVFKNSTWPFELSERVECDIHSEGFSYFPYRFDLNQEKIFGLLMGRSIYPDGKDAIRELLQNAVDACQLRDALLRVHRPSVDPGEKNRISIAFRDAAKDGGNAIVTVSDTGTGMDSWIIENFFLKVGDSYYRSSDFLRVNSILWEKHAGFTPVSDFGIGFLSCFMLASRIEVETSMLNSPRGDLTRRHLDIDGLGRLISVTEFPNSGYSMEEGTRVVLHLDASKPDAKSLDWSTLVSYLRTTCVDLPYILDIRHLDENEELLEDIKINPRGLSPLIPVALESSAIRIKIGSSQDIAQGEAVLFSYPEINAYQEKETQSQKYLVASNDEDDEDEGMGAVVGQSILSRGGFSLGRVPGLPSYIGFRRASVGLLKINSQQNATGRYLGTNVARNALVDGIFEIEQLVVRSWLEPMIQDINVVRKLAPENLSVGRAANGICEAKWLEEYSAYQIYLTARELALNRHGQSREETISKWERGELDRMHLGIFKDCLHRVLFQIVLPQVADLIYGTEGKLFVGKPKDGWIDCLKNNKSFISKPQRWSLYARYVGFTADYLYYGYSGCEWLSDKYIEKFRNFNEEEISSLIQLFEKLIRSKQYNYLIVLSSREDRLLKSAVAVAPEGLLGSSGVNGVALKEFLK